MYVLKLIQFDLVICWLFFFCCSGLSKLLCVVDFSHFKWLVYVYCLYFFFIFFLWLSDFISSFIHFLFFRIIIFRLIGIPLLFVSEFSFYVCVYVCVERNVVLIVDVLNLSQKMIMMMMTTTTTPSNDYYNNGHDYCCQRLRLSSFSQFIYIYFYRKININFFSIFIIYFQKL